MSNCAALYISTMISCSLIAFYVHSSWFFFKCRNMHPVRGHDLAFTLPMNVSGQVKADETRYPGRPHAFEITFIGNYTFTEACFFYQDVTYQFPRDAQKPLLRKDPNVSFSPITWEVSGCTTMQKSLDTFASPGPAPKRA